MSEDTQAGQAETVTDAGQEAQTPAAAPAPKESLAELIRVQRAEREGRARAQSEASDLRTQLEQARAELAKAKSADDPLNDPVGWAKARKLDKEAQAAIGQALLYDLVPEKAPADFRVKLLEAKMARDAKARESEAAEAKTKQAQQAQVEQIKQYGAALYAAASARDDGSYPESVAWFGDDVDAYSQSMLATAKNMADAAAKAGQLANLDPKNVAKVLEAEMARRMAARDAKRGKSSPESQQAEPGKTGEGTGSVLSTKGLSTNGAPRPKALTDKERTQRAIAAAFIRTPGSGA